MFWRWNGREQIRAACDGMEIFVQQPLPRGRKLKHLTLDADQRKLVAAKLAGMVSKSYLGAGFVSNSLHFFAVPKGDAEDIRVVFDGTSSALNETLWAPNFYLPTARAAAMNISYSSWMSDMVDCGEMFHNFFMNKRVRKCAGLRVDRIIEQLSTKEGGGKRSSYLPAVDAVVHGHETQPLYSSATLLLGRGIRKGRPNASGKSNRLQ